MQPFKAQGSWGEPGTVSHEIRATKLIEISFLIVYHSSYSPHEMPLAEALWSSKFGKKCMAVMGLQLMKTPRSPGPVLLTPGCLFCLLEDRACGLLWLFASYRIALSRTPGLVLLD